MGRENDEGDCVFANRSVLTFFQGLGHTIGGVFGKPEPGPMQAAVSAMQADTFPVMGFTRSFWDFHVGFGLSITVLLAMEAVVFWQFSLLKRPELARLRPVLATLALANVVLAVLSFYYFFWQPVVGELLIAICVAMAFVAAKAPIADLSRPLAERVSGV